jgi:hypothetical protein
MITGIAGSPTESPSQGAAPSGGYGAQPGDSSLAVQRKQDLVNYISNFYRSSWNWRSQSFHEKWNRWDRNYHSIYDPTKAARKEPWQVKMFIGITVQNVEIICSQIFKTMMAPDPPIQTKAGPAGDEMQAKLIEEVMAFQLRKSKFDVNFYDTLKEAVRYGSGFMKFFWERVIDTRPRKVAVNQPMEEFIGGLSPEQLSGQEPMGAPGIQGFEVQDVQVPIKNQLCAKYVHIRDVFPEPNSKTWNRVIHRDKIPYGDIVREIARGTFFDVKDKLENLVEGDKFEQDIREIKQELGYFEEHRDVAKFEKRHTVWEFYGNIPRKWIEFEIPDGDEAETLIPAKVMLASGCALLASEQNPFFDGQSPILKMDYIRTTESYGKGIPELIEDEQEEINEIRNQRVDNVNLIMNKMIGIFEAALVNPKDLVSRPGAIIRLKANISDDIRRVIMPIEIPDVTRSAYQETQDIERQVQERTGANRVTLGTAGDTNDTNSTLGGMELTRHMFNERVAAYGMVIEEDFLLTAAEKIYSLIYQELSPQDMLLILGDDPVTIKEDPIYGPIQVPRWQAFAFAPPEVVNQAYMFKPMGMFTLENKVVKTAQIMDAIKIGSVDPMRFDAMQALKYVLINIQGINEAESWFRPPMPGMPGLLPGSPPGAPGMAPGPGMAQPEMGGGNMPPPPGVPGMKGGPNGNASSFSPRTITRGQTVA